MEQRKQKIINYLILLQLFNYKIDKTRKFFIKYLKILNKKFEDCYFDIEVSDTNIFKKFDNKIKITANDCYEKYKNNIIYLEDLIFPERLKNIEEFPILLFYNGNIDLLNEYSISVVGTRFPSEHAQNNAKRISDFLINEDICIVSGLAKGIDYIVQHYAENKCYKKLIAVLGTSIDKFYPKENKLLQTYIGKYCLIISEYPDFEPTFKWNFLRRNYVMSAISDSTIVIEAGDTSGTVSQARSTLKNKKKLYVPASVFDDKNNSWPQKFKNDFGNVYRFSYIEELKHFISEEKREYNASNNR